MISWVFLVLPIVLWGMGAGTYEWPKWVSLALCGAAFAVEAMWRRKPLNLDAIDGLSAALLLWAFLSVLWSPDIAYAMLCASRAAVLWLVFVGIRRSNPGRWMGWVAATVVVSALLNYTLPEGGAFGGFGNQNTATEAVLISLPMLPGGWVGVALAGASVWFLYMLGSHLSLAVLCMFVAYLTIRYGKKNGAAVLMIVALFGGVVLFDHPELYQAKVISHAYPRVQVWLATLRMIGDFPLFGGGFGTFEFYYPDYQAWPIDMFPGLKNREMSSVFIRPGAAHQEFLQLWSELGVVGAGLFAALIATTLKQAKNTGAAWGVVTALSLCLFDFPLQKPVPGLLAVIALAATVPAFELGKLQAKGGALSCEFLFRWLSSFSWHRLLKRGTAQGFQPSRVGHFRVISKARPSN